MRNSLHFSLIIASFFVISNLQAMEEEFSQENDLFKSYFDRFLHHQCSHHHKKQHCYKCPQGPTGATGSVGPMGPMGSVGPAGPAGSNGMNGENGVNGLNGESGTNGANGENGTNGANGTNGTNGANGANGENGAIGPAGTPGPTGTTGPAGATGATGTISINLASAYDTSAQNISNSIPTILDFGFEQYPSIGINHNNSSFEIQNTGTYLITWSLIITAFPPSTPSTSSIFIDLLNNGSPINPTPQALASLQTHSGDTIEELTLTNSISLHLTAFTVLELQATGSGTVTGTIADIANRTFTITQIGP